MREVETYRKVDKLDMARSLIPYRNCDMMNLFCFFSGAQKFKFFETTETRALI